MISAPTTEDHPAILADWLEIQALVSPNRQANIFSLKDLQDLTQDAEAEDIADFDALCDAIISRVTAELSERSKVLGISYPYSVNAEGTLLTLQEAVGASAAIYLFCLLMSHVTNSSLLDQFDLTTEARLGRDVFQICATLAAAGYCGGPAISFGWPRRDRSKFADKLAESYAAFGDGRSRNAPLAGAPEHIKDGGIDVIAWRKMKDGLPGTSYLLGQVASGNDWKSKSVLNDIKSFHWAWFEVAPATQHVGAMFVPFCFTDTGETGGEFADQEMVISKMQFIVKEFGIFFYRYRLPEFAERGLVLAASGVAPIEGVAEIQRVPDWVQAVRGRLVETGAAAAQ